MKCQVGRKGVRSPDDAGVRTDEGSITPGADMRIVADRLGKRYTSGGRALRVLDGVNLDIAPGSFVSVVGPSGSGKTTLLGLLAGLDDPTEGRIFLADTELSTLGEDGRAEFRRRHVGFVFQTFHLLPTLTALENVLVPLELNGEGRRARGTASGLLARVGLSDRLSHYPAQLSGGEQQRVALARAFANRPGILFADEPTGNLDSSTGDSIVGVLEDMNRQAGTTLVLVTHDADLAKRADRVVHLKDGRVVKDEACSR